MTEPNETPEPPQNRSRWIVVIVVLALAGGIAVAASQWSKPQPGQAPAPAPEPQASGALPEGHPPVEGGASMPPGGQLPPGHPPMDGSAGAGGAMGTMPPMAAPEGDPGYVSPEGVRALMKAGLAPTNRRVWVDEVPGVDLSKLSAKQKEIFLRRANSEDCVCGYTVATCRNFNPPCATGPGKAAALFDSVRTGRYKDAAGLRERPKGAVPTGHPATN